MILLKSIPVLSAAILSKTILARASAVLVGSRPILIMSSFLSRSWSIMVSLESSSVQLRSHRNLLFLCLMDDSVRSYPTLTRTSTATSIDSFWNFSNIYTSSMTHKRFCGSLGPTLNIFLCFLKHPCKVRGNIGVLCHI